MKRICKAYRYIPTQTKLPVTLKLISSYNKHKVGVNKSHELGTAVRNHEAVFGERLDHRYSQCFIHPGLLRVICLTGHFPLWEVSIALYVYLMLLIIQLLSVSVVKRSEAKRSVVRM